MKLTPIDVSANRRDGNLAAKYNEQSVLRHVRDFGHLRTTELARIVWPNSPPYSAREMARRTARRLVSAGLLLVRRNALASSSLVLTRKGAEAVRAQFGIVAYDGYDIQGVSGSTYFHRTLATAYLAERIAGGERAWGEYAIARGWAPASLEHLKLHCGKLPDGLVAVNPLARGMSADTRTLDWIEVESTYKPHSEVVDVLRIATLLGTEVQGWHLDRLVLVYDCAQRHEDHIVRVAKHLARTHARDYPIELLESVELIRCSLAYPMTLLGHQSVSLASLLTGH
jgi:hypothetical protein